MFLFYPPALSGQAGRLPGIEPRRIRRRGWERGAPPPAPGAVGLLGGQIQKHTGGRRDADAGRVRRIETRRARRRRRGAGTAHRDQVGAQTQTRGGYGASRPGGCRDASFDLSLFIFFAKYGLIFHPFSGLKARLTVYHIKDRKPLSYQKAAKRSIS